jgi:hypothetical protein
VGGDHREEEEPVKLKPVKTDHKPWHTEEYIAYLDSPEWAATRTAALERAGHRCEFAVTWWDTAQENGETVWTKEHRSQCPATTGLEVHHRHYRTLGNEAWGDLVVLCHEHHENADRRRQSARRHR